MSTNKKKILLVASEVAPFISTGGLGESVGALVRALAANGSYDVRVVLPLYQDIAPNYRKNFRFVKSITTPLSWRNQYCGIFQYAADNVTYYFIDNEYYFKRRGCYGYFDDGERFAFFCSSVMEILPHVGFFPDLLHCHDWQSALAALYLKTNYCKRKEYERIEALFTIHSMEFQGKYSMGILEDLFGLSKSYVNLVEFNGEINLMKGAIECCERFTLSERCARATTDTSLTYGLDCILRRNETKLFLLDEIYPK